MELAKGHGSARDLRSSGMRDKVRTRTTSSSKNRCGLLCDDLPTKTRQKFEHRTRAPLEAGTIQCTTSKSSHSSSVVRTSTIRTPLTSLARCGSITCDPQFCSSSMQRVAVSMRSWACQKEECSRVCAQRCCAENGVGTQIDGCPAPQRQLIE